MNLFLKHEVKENSSRFEAILFLNKHKVDNLNDEEFHIFLKKEAIAYIKRKFKLIPIAVVHIKVGPIQIFSFATNTSQH